MQLDGNINLNPIIKGELCNYTSSLWLIHRSRGRANQEKQSKVLKE